ncbi:hypothetical protein BH23THE1_BH23THE1_11980 [soil metagenome]
MLQKQISWQSQYTVCNLFEIFIVNRGGAVIAIVMHYLKILGRVVYTIIYGLDCPLYYKIGNQSKNQLSLHYMNIGARSK